MFPSEQVDGLWAAKSEGVRLIVSAIIYFQDFQVPTYMVMTQQRYRQTDGQTDDMRSQYRALHDSSIRTLSDMRLVVDEIVSYRVLPSMQSVTVVKPSADRPAFQCYSYGLYTVNYCPAYSRLYSRLNYYRPTVYAVPQVVAHSQSRPSQASLVLQRNQRLNCLLYPVYFGAI